MGSCRPSPSVLAATLQITEELSQARSLPFIPPGAIPPLEAVGATTSPLGRQLVERSGARWPDE